MEFARRLKERRKSLGLKQQDIADHLGISNTTVSKWEHGIFDPDTSTLKKLAAYLRVDVNYLVGFDEEEKEPIIALLEKVKDHPYITHPQTGEIRYFPKERLKIIVELIENYLREEGILPKD